MNFSDDLQIDHRHRKDVFDYVEQHGEVEADVARRALGMDETEFGIYVSVLQRQDFLARENGTVRVAFDAGDAELVEDGDTAFVIRQATEDDREGIVAVIRDALSDHADIVAGNVAAVVDHERVLLRRNELKSRVFFVATIDDEVVGWVHLDANEVDALDHTAELTVGVLEAHRGQGIGSHLLQRGVEWARENGIEKVYESLPATNERGIEWLEDHGWETRCRREDHYRIDGDSVDEVLMARWV